MLNLEAGGSSSDDSAGDYELNEQVRALIALWRTELQAPEVLPFQRELVTGVRRSLESQQDLIDSKLDEGREEEYFTTTLYQADIDRVRFSLMKYLRTRIFKIERQLHHILGDLELLDRLSSHEKLYATKLNNLTNQFVEDTVITRLSASSAEYFQQNDDFYKQAQPLMQKFVFCQALEDIADVPLGGDRYQTFGRGDIAVLRYQAIRSHILRGEMQLI